MREGGTPATLARRALLPESTVGTVHPFVSKARFLGIGEVKLIPRHAIAAAVLPWAEETESRPADQRGRDSLASSDFHNEASQKDAVKRSRLANHSAFLRCSPA